MRHLTLTPFILLYIGCSTQNAHTLNAGASQKVSLRDQQVLACEKDEDCTFISESCCGCNQGGKKVSIGKKYALEIESDRQEACAATMCIQAMSNDASCRWTSAICVENKCAGQ